MLTKTEHKILTRLAWGKTYTEALKSFPNMRPCTFNVHCHNIRKKTGIKNTHDKEECRAFERSMAKPVWTKPPLLPTAKQIEIMKLLVEGKTWNQIVSATQTGWKTAQNHVSRACRRLGILRAGRGRTEAIRAWLAKAGHIQPENDPMF